MRFSNFRWQVLGLVAAVATVQGCSCHVSKISQAKGDPLFVNTRGDTAISIVDDSGKAAPTGGKTATVDFGATLVNQDQPNQKTLFITNNGVASVEIQALKKVDPFDSDDFKVPTSDQVKQAIGPGQTGSIIVSFVPTAAGDFASDFTLQTDADDPTSSKPLTVHLKGSGVSNGCVLAPADKLDFGNVRVNSSETKTLVVQNTTPIDYTFTFNGITGPDAALFTTSLALGDVTIHAHDSLSIPVTYTANHKDVAAAELTFTSPADMCAPEPFDLRATGVDSLITATPDPLDFGFVDPGVTWGSVKQNVTLTNIGNDQLTLNTAMVCDGTWGGSYNAGCTVSSEFDADPTGGHNIPTDVGSITLGAGQSKQVTLYFKPARLHSATAYMQYKIGGVEAQSDFGFNLKGVGGGPKISVSPTHVDYGVVALGAPQSHNITITNIGSSPAGQAGSALDIDHVKTKIVPGTGTQDGEFTVVPALTADILLGATQRYPLAVQFNPNGAGAKTATLQIFSNDPVNGEVDVPLQADGENLPPCTYTVSPDTLNFGNVGAGRNRILSFKITNTGATDCLLSNLDLGGDTSSPPFSLPNGPIASQTLAAGSSLDVPVKFAPIDTHPTDTGSVVFFTSSTTAAQATVTLSGGSAQGCVLITPDDLDFGVVQQGCASKEQTFTVYNVCSATQHLTTIDFLPDANNRCPDQGTNSSCPFRITAAPTLPATIPAGGSAVFKIKYQPPAVQQDAVSVEVQTQELATPYVVTLEGRGDTTAIQTDTYRQDAQPKVDVLLVVDDSGSMETKQQALATNFQSFIQFAVNQQVDYHIAVTTTSTGADPSVTCGTTNGDPNNGSIAVCGTFAPDDSSRPRVLTNTTPNLEQIFAQNVAVGTWGSGTEMGFEGAYEALSPPNITGANANFLRDDANLAIVAVSDASDQSPQPYDFYKNFFLNIKGFSRQNAFSFSAVSSTTDTPPPTSWGCDYDGTNAVPNPYQQMAQDTNGIFQEICTDDWATSLRQLGQSAFGYRTTFFLSETPDTSYPITVAVDGVDLPAVGANGAQHWFPPTGSQNAITFAPLSVPEPGSTLTITYHVLCYPP
ncbi:MAG: choice-of-anchor D domain-containing protein [Deltaproteobacteria bacterium]|nr:choice-of-anchor D domain-containing protein [Deltaproteobacteria bacterium]